MQDLELAIDRGNHKSASTTPYQISDLAEEDIKASFEVPIAVDLVILIENLVLSPHGIAD